MSDASDDDRCGHCNNNFMDTKVLMKPCSCCGRDRYVHSKCARKYYSWYSGMKKEMFTVEKFQRRTILFFCINCHTKTCAFCKKQHNVGEPKSFPLLCSQGHWLVSTHKCSPEGLAGSVQRWFCSAHVNEHKNNTEYEFVIPRAVQRYPLPKNLYRRSVTPITKWYTDGIAKKISFFNKKKISSFTGDDFLPKILDQFRSLMKYSCSTHNKITKSDRDRRTKNKIFMDHLRTMKKFQPFQDENGRLKKQDTKNILAKGTNFTVITQFFLESIYNTGQKGFVEDVSFIIFHYFLQEIVLLDNENSRTKVPHIFMDSQTDYHLAPPTTEYLNADVNLLFYNDPKLYTCEILTASEWYADEYNRNRFGHEYKHWFEDAAKHRFDNIFDKLEESNEVSNIIHHTNQ